jgi:hypothetical protein
MQDSFVLSTDYASIIAAVFAGLGAILAAIVAVRQASMERREKRRAWLNDQRQDVYPKFIAASQSVLDACEELERSDVRESVVIERLQNGYRELVIHNAVIQTLGLPNTIQSVRQLMYNSIALMDICLGRKEVPREYKNEPREYWNALVDGTRESRHLALIAMRSELGIQETAVLREEDLDKRLPPLLGRPEEEDADDVQDGEQLMNPQTG